VTALPASRRGPLLLSPAVTIPLTGLLAVVAFTAQWYAPSSGLVWMVLWELVAGTGFALAGCLVTAAHRRSVPGGLLIVAALLLFSAATVAGGYPRLCMALWVLVVLVIVPMALLRVIQPRPVSALMRVGDVLVVGIGAIAAAGLLAGEIVVVALASTFGAAVILAAGWVLFECTAGDDRRRVLWVILGGVVSVPTTALLLVANDTPGPASLVLAITMAAVSLVLPLTATIALVNPRIVDVRAVISRVAVLTVMFALTLAVYEGGEATTKTITGAPATMGVRLALVLVVAAGFHPTMRWIRGSLDEMLFGGRADPVDTLTRLGSQLAAGSTPAEWLETLRVALAVPGVVLRGGGDVIASAGTPDGARTATTALRAGAEHVGDLVVTLPGDQLAPPPRTSAVLALVAPPLAQALHADRLAEELRVSRGRVVAALEEERRRMRRDLHDGLGPTLTGIAYGADAASNLIPTDPGQARDVLRQLRADTGEAIAEIRRIVYGLRPKALDELGLVGAVRQRISHLRAADGVVLAIELTAPDPLPELPAAVEVAAYRVAVEAVTNVARHSGVAAASVEFALVDDVLRVVVRDRGSGAGDWREGVGLRSMRERVEQIGGTLTVHSGASGATVSADIPLHVPTG